MVKPDYAFAKRQRDTTKKQKKEAKRQKKAAQASATSVEDQAMTEKTGP